MDRKHAEPDLESLADDARALMAATADVAEEKVIEARKRLGAALNNGKELYEQLKENAVASAKAADKTVREHPYQAIAIAAGVGALIGFLAARQYSRKSD